MQAHAESQTTKPISSLDVERASRRSQLRKELELDAELVLSGLRLMNRPSDNAKERFIQSFVRNRVIEKFPVIAEDLSAESEVRWYDSEDRRRSPDIKTVLAKEVDEAFRLAEAEPLVSSYIVATKILSSDVGSNTLILADVPIGELDVDLILGHIVSLGYRWHPRIAISVARRTMIVLLNRNHFNGRTS